MDSKIIPASPNLLPLIREKENLIFNKQAMINTLQQQLENDKVELQHLQKQVAQNTTFQWKHSITWCLDVDSKNPSYFLKTPAFVSKCVTYKYGVQNTRDIKNKIATTLSLMFNQKQLGRIQHKGKTYYGKPHFFKNDMVTLKPEYRNWIEDLLQ
jgi:hypothetical protein